MAVLQLVRYIWCVSLFFLGIWSYSGFDRSLVETVIYAKLFFKCKLYPNFVLRSQITHGQFSAVYVADHCSTYLHNICILNSVVSFFVICYSWRSSLRTLVFAHRRSSFSYIAKTPLRVFAFHTLWIGSTHGDGSVHITMWDYILYSQ